MKFLEWEVTEDSYQEQKMLQGSGRIRIRLL